MAEKDTFPIEPWEELDGILHKIETSPEEIRLYLLFQYDFPRPTKESEILVNFLRKEDEGHRIQVLRTDVPGREMSVIVYRRPSDRKSDASEERKIVRRSMSRQGGKAPKGVRFRGRLQRTPDDGRPLGVALWIPADYLPDLPSGTEGVEFEVKVSSYLQHHSV